MVPEPNLCMMVWQGKRHDKPIERVTSMIHSGAVRSLELCVFRANWWFCVIPGLKWSKLHWAQWLHLSSVFQRCFWLLLRGRCRFVGRCGGLDLFWRTPGTYISSVDEHNHEYKHITNTVDRFCSSQLDHIRSNNGLRFWNSGGQVLPRIRQTRYETLWNTDEVRWLKIQRS